MNVTLRQFALFITQITKNATLRLTAKGNPINAASDFFSTPLDNFIWDAIHAYENELIANFSALDSMTVASLVSSDWIIGVSGTVYSQKACRPDYSGGNNLALPSPSPTVSWTAQVGQPILAQAEKLLRGTDSVANIVNVLTVTVPPYTQTQQGFIHELRDRL